MFPIDERVKYYLLGPNGQIAEDTALHFYLDRYWNQLVLYLLLSPLQLLHLVHMLYCTYWNEYYALTKTAMLLYVTMCLIFWEILRISVYHTLKAMGPTDMKQLAYRMASAAQEVGKDGLARAKPHYDKLHQSVVHLATKAKDSLTRLIARP